MTLRRKTLLACALCIASVAAGESQIWTSPPPLKGPCPDTVDGKIAWFDPNLYPQRANGVKLPRALYHPDPDYSESARQSKTMGTVLLALAINAAGTVDEVKVACSLEPGLDANAAAAAKKWKFTPATEDGEPVPVQIEVAMGFRLY